MMSTATRNAARAGMPAPCDEAVPGLKLVSPPAGLEPFGPGSLVIPGRWVDYAAHPDYAPLIESASMATRVRALLHFGRYFAWVLFKRLVSYELIPAHLRRPGSPGAAWAGLRLALRHAARTVLPPLRPSALGPAAAQVAGTLRRDGVCVAQIGAQEMARITQAAEPLFDGLRQRRGTRAEGGRAFDESRACALRTMNADLFDAVDAMLRESGVLAGVSAYLGRQARLVDVNPQINDRTDDFWRRIFPDRPVSERPCAYYHRDASGGDVKAIIYMSDVGSGQGPFSFSLGSHRLRPGLLRSWIEETNDHSGCSDTSAPARARFAALPAALRHKAAFGNDLLPGSAIAEHMLRAEWRITATRGHIVVFDTKGLHRGGMVTDGERLVLTCTLG